MEDIRVNLKKKIDSDDILHSVIKIDIVTEKNIKITELINHLNKFLNGGDNRE